MTGRRRRGDHVPASEERARRTVRASLEHDLVPADVEADVRELFESGLPAEALDVLVTNR